MRVNPPGRKAKPEGEKLQSVTIQLRPATIAKLRQWARKDKARKQGKLIDSLLVEFFSELQEKQDDQINASATTSNEPIS